LTGLGPLIGHEQVREMLAASIDRGELPAALLLHGPAGIGKQRLALWLAQRLVCEAPDGTEPCGTCHSCHLALRLEHPDLHWFFPLPRPRSSGGADRLGEALEEARAAELQARRADPWYPTHPNEPTGIYVAHVQVIRRLAVARPAMGNRKVFVIGDAESLVPQEASPEAANALLKLLEEPPPDTSVILTASDLDALLPTIRSRLLFVRVLPLSLDRLERFLREQRGVEPRAAARVARLAEGSIGRALAFLPVDDEPGPLEVARLQALSLLDAALDGGHARYARALEQAPARARGDFATVLGMLIVWLRDVAAVAVGADDAVVNADHAADLRERAVLLPDAARRVAQTIPEVERMLQLVSFSINPQLSLATLLGTMSKRLGVDPGAPARRRPARVGP
jgi:DNA polymerase-3 subunit delta'